MILTASVFMSEYSDKGDLQFYIRLCKFNDACYFTDAELDPMDKDLSPIEMTKRVAVDPSSGSKLRSYEYETIF